MTASGIIMTISFKLILAVSSSIFSFFLQIILSLFTKKNPRDLLEFVTVCHYDSVVVCSSHYGTRQALVLLVCNCFPYLPSIYYPVVDQWCTVTDYGDYHNTCQLFPDYIMRMVAVTGTAYNTQYKTLGILQLILFKIGFKIFFSIKTYEYHINIQKLNFSKIMLKMCYV